MCVICCIVNSLKKWYDWPFWQFQNSPMCRISIDMICPLGICIVKRYTLKGYAYISSVVAGLQFRFAGS